MKKEIIPLLCIGLWAVIFCYALVITLCRIKSNYVCYHLALDAAEWRAQLIYVGTIKAGKTYGAWKQDGELQRGEIRLKLAFDDNSPGNFKYLIHYAKEDRGLLVKMDLLEQENRQSL